MTTVTTYISARGLTFTADLAGPEGGELVLFLHGFPQTRYTWRAELVALAGSGYRCCAYDQRGYSAGARPAGVDAYRLEELIADVLAIVEALGYARCHLVGHDWGGQVAWCTAALHPDLVASLAIISRPHPAAFIRALSKDSAQAARSGHHQKFQDSSAAADLLDTGAAGLLDMYIKWGGVPAADAQVYLATLGSHDALDAAINWYRAVAKTAISIADLPEISMPTLYVWGTGDATVGRLAAEGTRSMVAGPFEFVQLQDVGHFVTDEAPGVFADVLLKHVSRHGRR